MTMENITFAAGAAPAGRKPRLALMGEFSAGKSTLANLLTGGAHLPVQVTATQLPPVWISHGTAPAHRVDLEGKIIPVSLARLEDVPLNETAYVRLFARSDMLERCDIIDMPGISDPNMSALVWQRVLPQADGVIWCTHATQAWRQSESAIWASMSPALQQRSLLLLTRIDKIVVPRDRVRIVRRVNHETEGQFAGPCLAVALTQALAAAGRTEAMEAAGATALLDRLNALVTAICADLGQPRSVATPSQPADRPSSVMPRRIRPEAGVSAPRPTLDAMDPAFRAMMRGAPS